MSITRTPIRVAVGGTLAAALLLGGLAVPGAQAVPVGDVEDLGEPLQDVLMIGGDVGPGPNGETVIWSAVSSQPATLNAVDPNDGSVVASYPLEGAGGSWEVNVSPDGSVYVATYSSSKLFRWTVEGGLEDLGNPTEEATFTWTVATDADGVAYGGTTPDGAVFSWDPETEEFRNYGRISESDYVRSVAAHDGVIYAGTSPEPWLFAIEAESGEITQMPSPPDLDPALEETYDVDVVDGYLYVRYGGAFPGELHVWDIEAQEWIDMIPNAHGLQVSEANEAGDVYIIADDVLQRYNPAEGVLEATDVTFTGRVKNTRGIGWAELDDPNFPGQSIVGLLWRGMMFRYSPETGHHDFVETSVPGTPIPVTVLAEGVDGRVHAGGFLSGGFGTFDQASGEQSAFQRFAQMESMVSHGGKTYLGAYPDARLYEYDPEMPWHSEEYSPAPEEGTADNPRQIVNLMDDDQVRAGALVSAGDYVALGTEPALDQWGGVFLLWDPERDEVTFQERGLVADQSVVALAYRDGIVYGATSIFGGYTATTPKAEEAVVFAFSLETMEKLWEVVPVEGAATVHDLAFDADGTLWGTGGGKLFSMDVSDQSVAVAGVPYESAEFVEFNEVDGLLYVDWAGDGLGWFDPATGEHAVLTEANARAHIVDSQGEVWFSAESHVYRFGTEGDQTPEDPTPTPDPDPDPDPDPTQDPDPDPDPTTPPPDKGGKRPGLPSTGR